MDDLKAKGTLAFIWDFVGKMAKQGMSFIVSIFLARLLEPSDFGLIAMVSVIIGLATIFIGVGLGGALIQRRRVRPVHYSSVFYLNLAIGSLLTVITFFSASWISEFYRSPELYPLVQVMSFSFVLNALASVQFVILTKELKYALMTKISLISSLISGVVGVSLAFWGAGVWSLVAQTLIAGIMSNILLWKAANWVPGWMFSWKALMQLWGYGFRMFLAGVLEKISIYMDTMIIGRLFAASTLGYFERAKSLDGMITKYSSGSLMSVLFPVLSKIQNDLPRFQNVVIKSLGIISFVVFLLIGVFYLISEELIVLLFSAKWLPSVEFFQILVLSGFAYPVSALLVNILSSRGNSKAFLRLEIYKKILVAINLIVLYYWGIKVYLYGIIIEAVLGVSLNIIFASKEIKLPFFAFARPIVVQMGIAVVTIFIIYYITKDLEFMYIVMILIKGSLFTILYVGCNYLLKTNSFTYFMEQFIPIYQKIQKKRRGK